jgi:hypothetical protein
MIKFRVALIQQGDQPLRTLFDCEAKDKNAAEEAAKKAYPGCTIVNIYPWAK